MKVSILIPHFRTWRWTAVCIWHFKKFGLPVPSEIILVDNSPGHPSIKAITQTELGEGVKVLSGDPEFASHGNGYDIAARAATGTHFFTAETDSMPTRCGWFDEYVKAVGDGYDLIGPEIPQSAGRYVHPAGALLDSRVYNAAIRWQKNQAEWFFCPGAAVMMQYADRGYHVVCRGEDALRRVLSTSALAKEIDIWAKAGPYQEMRCFEDDSFETYPQRTGIGLKYFSPLEGKGYYLKIGYEAGQWLAYFAEAHGFKVLRAPTEIRWMEGHENQQAAASTVFGGFTHYWGGTVSNVAPEGDFNAGVRRAKMAVQDGLFAALPEKLRNQIEAFERANP